jgi:hypothetical protein
MIDKQDRLRRGLNRLVQKRCTTIFIGALDSIEQKFGRLLWGIDKDLRDLTERERVFLELWKSLRKEILDKGNNQTKSLLKELELFELSMKQFSYSVSVDQEYSDE